MYSLDFLYTVDGWVTLLTVSFLEVILGIDNIIFIAIVSDKLPQRQQAMSRNLGLSLALVIRIILLFFIGLILSLTKPLFTLNLGFEWGCSGRDLILLLGGVFLTFKTCQELYEKATHKHGSDADSKKDGSITLASAVLQIVVIDTVFSFDSILAAIPMCSINGVANISLMIATVIVAMIIMILFSAPVSKFVNKNSSVKTLALAFLVMIGVILLVEAFHGHVEKSLVYFALAFSLAVELLNMWERSNAHKKQHDNPL